MKKKDMVKIDGKVYKKNAFLIEEEHPAIGRILIVEGVKFKIIDPKFQSRGDRVGTFISKLTEEDEQQMQEYDEALDLISEKLSKKVDIKRVIKENLKTRPLQDIKTGLFILEAEDRGEKVEKEESRGCYHMKLLYKNQSFSFVTGTEVPPLQPGESFV